MACRRRFRFSLQPLIYQTYEADGIDVAYVNPSRRRVRPSREYGNDIYMRDEQ